MKRLITSALILISSFVFSQNLDSLTFEYINVYRVKNGKQPLVWSKDLYKNCVSHSDKMIVNDSCYHSHLGYSECVSYSAKATFENPKIYKDFIKKYYNFSYEEILKDTIKYLATVEVYTWAYSPSHNKIMLSDFKEGAVHVTLKSIEKHNNFVWGREVFPGYGKFIYLVTSASTFELK